MEISYVKEKIFGFDNIPDILDYRIKGKLSCWLLIRYEIYKKIFLDELIFNHAYAEKKSPVRRKFLSGFMEVAFIIRLMKRTSGRANQKYDIVNFCSSTTTFETNGKFTSRITGFLDEMSDLKTLHVFTVNKNTAKRKYRGNYIFFNKLFWPMTLLTKFRGSASSPKEELYIRQFLRVVKGHFQTIDNQIINDFYKGLLYNSNQFNYYNRKIERLLRKTNPSLIIVQDGNYGYFEQAMIIQSAKKLGIKTVEIEHGILGMAYRYGSALQNSNCLLRQKTDYFLTFGQYFTDYVEMQIGKRNLGFYYLELQKAKAKRIYPCKQLLFITQGNITNPIINILVELKKDFYQELEIVIKLHPSEIDTSRYTELMQLPGAKLLHHFDIFELIAASEYIVGMYSTVLFESVAIGKRPAIYKSDLTDEFVPEDIGPRFSNARELMKIITDQNENFKPNYRDFWSNGVKENFRDFYCEIVDNCEESTHSKKISDHVSHKGA